MTEIRLTSRAWDDVAEIETLDLFFVDNTNLTDDVATRLRFLPVEYLSRACCQITDKTIFHLASLYEKKGTPLVQLEIYSTAVGDASLTQLSRSIPKNQIEIILMDDTKATGNILSKIVEMTDLRWFRPPTLTNEQLAELQKALPACEMS